MKINFQSSEPSTTPLKVVNGVMLCPSGYALVRNGDVFACEGKGHTYPADAVRMDKSGNVVLICDAGSEND